jgi:hypothetical protein
VILDTTPEAAAEQQEVALRVVMVVLVAVEMGQMLEQIALKRALQTPVAVAAETIHTLV